MNHEKLTQRASAMKHRAALMGFEYRQRNHANGVWFHLRRALADSRRAYTISESVAQELLLEGAQKVEAGERLEPPKVIFVVSEKRMKAVSEKHPIAVRLGPEFLTAQFIALSPF